MKLAKSLILTLSFMVFAFTGNANAAEGDYKELSWEKKHELLTNIAIEYNIPPEILKAIAVAENDMMQFENGNIHVTEDGGMGMMQITNTEFDFDEEKLKTDTAYNIEAGAKVLNRKWEYMNAGNLPKINGANDRQIIEQWYYPIMAYNGVSNRNNPDKENREGPTYQQKVFSIIEESSFVQIADTPDQFEFELVDGKLGFGKMSYTWEEADSHSTQMFETGDEVYVLNDGTTHFGKFREQKELTTDYTKIPYYTELKITDGPYFMNSHLNNHFIMYKVEDHNFSGYMASSNLRPMETLPSGFKEMDPRTEVAIDKTWKINMNTRINPQTVNPRNVYIVREDGMGVHADVSVDGKTISVEPQNDYEPGQSYTLYIKDLESWLSRDLKQRVSMTFEVEQP